MRGSSPVGKLALTLLTVGITALNASADDSLDPWTKVTAVPNGNFNQVIYSNGVFVAVSGSPGGSGGISVSSNGLSWTHTAFSNAVTGVTFGNGRFLASVANAAGGSGELLYSTNNGAVWTPTTGFAPLNGVAFGGGVFVAVGSVAGSNQGIAYRAATNDWMSATVGTAPLERAVYGNGIFLTTISFTTNGGLKGQVLSSPDATTWSAAQTAFPTPLSSLAYLNGSYFAGSPSTDSMWTRLNSATNWANYPGPAPILYTRIGQSNFVHAAVGTNGKVYISSSPIAVFFNPATGFNWATHSTGFTNDLTSIAFDGRRFVAVGSDGAIFVSAFANPLVLFQQKVIPGMQLVVSGGPDPFYTIQASDDFTTWTNMFLYTNTGKTVFFLDKTATNVPQRFYRFVP